MAEPAQTCRLKLKSRDGAVFDVEKAVAVQINFVKVRAAFPPAFRFLCAASARCIPD